MCVASESFASVFVVLTQEGEPWNDRAFGTERHACGSVRDAMGVYWPRLEGLGWRIALAELHWS